MSRFLAGPGSPSARRRPPPRRRSRRSSPTSWRPSPWCASTSMTIAQPTPPPRSRQLPVLSVGKSGSVD